MARNRNKSTSDKKSKPSSKKPDTEAPSAQEDTTMDLNKCCLPVGKFS